MLEELLNSALDAQEAETTDGEVVETTGEEAPETEAATTETETEPEEKPATEQTAAGQKTAAELKAEEEAIFDEKALATKDGQVALRQWARDQRAKYASIGGRLERKQARLAEKVREFAAERDQTRAEREQVSQFGQRLQATVAKLTNGTAAEIFSTLSELTKKEPAELYREISHLMASNGKSNGTTKSPETEKLRAELTELKNQLREREEQAANAAEAAAIEAAMDRIYSVAVATVDDVPTYPHIARLTSLSKERATAAREYLAELRIAAHNAGSKDPDTDAAKKLEAELTEMLGPFQPAAPTAKTGQAPASGQAPPAKKPPKQLTSKDRSAPAQRVERTETLEDLAKDQDFMGALFG